MNVDIRDIKIRTFGWVQNPSDFSKLKKVVQCFDYESATYKELINGRLRELILDKDGFHQLNSALKRTPLYIGYQELIGTSFTPRSSARCNGILQAVITGQKKDFTDDWTADGFLRWAHALGFIEYLYAKDAFQITQSGLDFSRTIEGTDEELSIKRTALMSYPPATRILTLLQDGDHLTKYELGKQLGFTGESGFTSLPQDVFLLTLANTSNPKEKNKMKSNWDGSVDKYARMISRWLHNVGLVSQVSKDFHVDTGTQVSKETIPHSFKITAEGLMWLRRSKGVSSYKRIPKRVFWEMMGSKGSDRIYVRTRRSLALKVLMQNEKNTSLEEISKYLLKHGFNDSETIILDDLKGLRNIGLNIIQNTYGFTLNDTILDFTIPTIPTKNKYKSNIQQQIDNLRPELRELSHEYLSLIDLSVTPKQNRLFEMKTIELLIKEIGFQGVHLGGSRKPDGVIYTNKSKVPYGIIVDTKAYKDGYSLPISQADEMQRYVTENNERNPEINENLWWNVYPEKINKFVFLFVSNKFIGKFENHLERIHLLTSIKGGALEVVDLLLFAEYYKRSVVNHDTFLGKFNNELISF